MCTRHKALSLATHVYCTYSHCFRLDSSTARQCAMSVYLMNIYLLLYLFKFWNIIMCTHCYELWTPSRMCRMLMTFSLCLHAAQYQMYHHSFCIRSFGASSTIYLKCFSLPKYYEKEFFFHHCCTLYIQHRFKFPDFCFLSFICWFWYNSQTNFLVQLSLM